NKTENVYESDNKTENVYESDNKTENVYESDNKTENVYESDRIYHYIIDKCLKNTTHLELTFQSLFSYTALSIPFPEHNQSPRNTYQCAMAKQAIGQSSYNLSNVEYFNFYGQVPLTHSIISEKIVSGQNLIIAVMSLTGYDIEDAVILNKQAIDRGMARITLFKDVDTEI
ncbi:RNA polymerase III, second largest subunit, partial [Pseudoloma neurophilia]